MWDVVSQEDGEEYNESIVVSSNRELVDAMKKSFIVLKLFGEGPYGMEIGDDTESMMIIENDYALLSAEGLEFVSLNHDKIADGIIKLPQGATEDIEELLDMIDGEAKLGKEVFKTVLNSNEISIPKQGEQ